MGWFWCLALLAWLGLAVHAVMSMFAPCLSLHGSIALFARPILEGVCIAVSSVLSYFWQYIITVSWCGCLAWLWLVPCLCHLVLARLALAWCGWVRCVALCCIHLLPWCWCWHHHLRMVACDLVGVWVLISCTWSYCAPRLQGADCVLGASLLSIMRRLSFFRCSLPPLVHILVVGAARYCGPTPGNHSLVGAATIPYSFSCWHIGLSHGPKHCWAC